MIKITYKVLAILCILLTSLMLPGVCKDTSTSNSNIDIQIVKIEELSELIKPPNGGFTILNLWATWCLPCVKELPHFVEFYKKHGTRTVKICLISVEGKESEEQTLKPFLEKHPIPFRVYLIEKGTPEEIESVLKTKISGALPITIIYASNGEIIKKFEGPITLEELEKATNLSPTK